MEIEVIRNGKKTKLPFHFGFNAMASFSEQTGLTLDEFFEALDSKLSFAYLRKLAYWGLFYGHNKSIYKDQPFDLTEESVGDLFDQNGLMNMTLIVTKAVAEFMPKGGGEGNAVS